MLNGMVSIILIIIGIAALFSIIGIGAMLVGPLILFIIGVVLLRKKHRFLGVLFVFFSFMSVFNNLFHIHLGGLILALILLYFGFGLLRKKEPNDPSEYGQSRRRSSYEKTIDSDDSDWVDIENGTKSYTNQKKVTVKERKSLIGDFRLMHDRYELENMNIWHGIGDVKIDLSKAIIPEGETVLIINGWIGDIDIYIPYDVDVSVNATVTFGELEILNRRQGGFHRQLSVATRDYRESTQRVKIVLSLFIGDIDVRFL